MFAITTSTTYHQGLSSNSASQNLGILKEMVDGLKLGLGLRAKANVVDRIALMKLIRQGVELRP